MKRLLSVLLAFVLVATTLPNAVQAANAPLKLQAAADGDVVAVSLSTTESFEMSALDFIVHVPDGCVVSSIVKGKDYAELGAAEPAVNGEIVSILAAQFNTATVVPADKEVVIITVDASGASADEVAVEIEVTAAADFNDTPYNWQGETLSSNAVAVGSSSTPAVQGYSASISTDAPTVQVNTPASVSVNVAHDTDTSFASGEVKVAIPSGVSVAETGAVKHGTEEVGYYIENSTLVIQDFGADKNMGNGVYVITYTAGSTAQTVNFVLTSAAFSDAASAAASDLKPATVDSTPLAITIKMAPVTVAEDASAAGFFQYTTSAEYGVPYTFAKETTTGAYYDYTNVQYKVGNGAWMNLTEENGTWTIPASAVTGNITLKATRTGIKPAVTWEGTGADDITTKPIAQYGTDFVVTHPENKPATTEPGYKYSISAKRGTEPIGSYNESTRTFTIAGNAITGPFTVTVDKTPITENQYSVTISGTAGLTSDVTPSKDVVNKGEDVTLTLTPELGYAYKVTVNGQDKTEEFADNTYTITNVTGAVSVSVAKSVDVTHKGEAHYLTLDGSNMMIVTIKPNEAGDQLTNKLYTYKTNKMFWSDQYKAYCYLEVAEGAATFDAGDETPVFDIVPGSVKSVDYGMDVNMTQKVDANDAQLVYNMYNEGDDLYFDGVDVEKFLRADTNWDMKVNVEDAQKIINYLLKKTEQ